ncbi:ADP-ribosylglycohydrolase family protein [Anabaena sp. FACHB-1237]|uniref:ADP-ribosylglycohydrolase family protein n=1 Tax=Anabaena sp. FACHB-1237 TaxID=2692769 RepID=UPI001680FCCB|nr:ADP-ribosylglycohydrolase family protein [Anabaena sp. FACHB-1237]MBD2136825.1 ADP-ribosylglycohydrolase family protein [Anabaena sp. FACHB-1237]
MRYSLVNRVRGAFLGAVLGEKLGTSNSGNLGKIAVAGTESLINSGKLDIDNWLLEARKINVELEDQLNDNIHSHGQRIIGTLPLAIFYHENLGKMRENILELVKTWGCDAIVRDGSLVIGYAIAKCLNEKLVAEKLIPEIIDFLGETSTLIPEKLMIVDHLLRENTGLEIVQSQIKSPEILTNNISLAIYTFLSTLEDFKLTVLRTSKNNYFPYPDITGAIAGALSGAYNSKISIPITWQTSLTSEKLPLWGLNNVNQMLKLADTMIAVWSGCYHVNQDIQDNVSNFSETEYNIVAAPDIISSY